jgi:hypothetical protein
MGTREIQTAYSGQRPNCFRSYDKKAERLKAYRSFVRGWNPKEPNWKEYQARASLDGTTEKCSLGELYAMFRASHDAWVRKVAEKAPKPTFEQFCGLHESTVLTRLERQIGPQQVGKVYQIGDATKGPIFSTLRDMKRNLVDFNPFHAMEFSDYGRPEPALPNGGNYSLMTYMAGMYFRERIEREGLQAARAWATPLSNNNMKAILQRLAAFLPAATTDNVIPLSGPRLYEQYREAISKQLAA